VAAPAFVEAVFDAVVLEGAEVPVLVLPAAFALVVTPTPIAVGRPAGRPLVQYSETYDDKYAIFDVSGGQN
jgi:hypothetical protein